MVNLGVFFTFLASLTWSMFAPMSLVNIVAVSLIPFIEGFEWMWVTVLYFVIISFMIIGFQLFKLKK